MLAEPLFHTRSQLRIYYGAHGLEDPFFRKLRGQRRPLHAFPTYPAPEYQMLQQNHYSLRLSNSSNTTTWTGGKTPSPPPWSYEGSATRYKSFSPASVQSNGCQTRTALSRYSYLSSGRQERPSCRTKNMVIKSTGVSSLDRRRHDSRFHIHSTAHTVANRHEAGSWEARKLSVYSTHATILARSEWATKVRQEYFMPNASHAGERQDTKSRQGSPQSPSSGSSSLVGALGPLTSSNC